MNRGVGGNDPGSVTDPTARQLVPDAADGRSRSAAGTTASNEHRELQLGHQPAVAKNPDGIVDFRPVVRYIVMGNPTTPRTRQSLSCGQDSASRRPCSRRASSSTTRRMGRPGERMEFVDAKTIRRLRPPAPRSPTTTSTSSATRAKDPTVNGIGFGGGVRFRRRSCASADDAGNANPVAGDGSRSDRISMQTGPPVQRLRPLASNQARRCGRCSTAMAVDRGGDGLNLNLPLLATRLHGAQPQDHLYAGRTVPVREREHHRSSPEGLRAATMGVSPASTRPFAMEIYSPNEYWVTSGVALPYRRKANGRPSGHRRRACTSSSLEHAARRRQRQREGQLPGSRTA